MTSNNSDEDWSAGDDDAADPLFTSNSYDPVREGLFGDSSEVHTLSLRGLEQMLHHNGYRESTRDDSQHRVYMVMLAVTRDAKTIEFQIWPDKTYRIREITEDIVIENERERQEIADVLTALLSTNITFLRTTQHFRTWAFGLMRRHESLRTLVMRHLDQVTARKPRDASEAIRRRLHDVLEGKDPLETGANTDDPTEE